MADIDRSLTSNEADNFEKESFDKQTVNEDGQKSLNNEKNSDSSSCSSYNSVRSTPSPEDTNGTTQGQLSDFSWNRHLTRAVNLKNGRVDCDLCWMKNLQIRGEFYCRYCDKCFCQNCISFHEGLTPEHDVANLMDPDKLTMKDVTPVPTCDKHKLPISLYCEECHICLCLACWEAHCTADGKNKITTCPPPISLNSRAKETRTQGIVLLESLNSFIEKATKQSELLDKAIFELTEKSEKKCESLWNELEILFTSLRHRLTLLISQIHTETHHQKSKLERKSVSWNEYTVEVKGVHSKLNELLKFANDADLVSAFKDFTSKKRSLDIDKFAPMVETTPMSVEVDYSQDYLNLQRNALNLVIGKTHLRVGNKTADSSDQQSISNQTLTECRTDVGTQCYEKEFLQSKLLSNLFLFNTDCLEEVDTNCSNSNAEGKSFCSPSLTNSCSSRMNLESFKSSSSMNASDVCSNKSDLNSLTTFSDICSPQLDFDNSASGNNDVLSPNNSGYDFGESDGKLTQTEVESCDPEFSLRQMTILKVCSCWPLSLEKNTYVRGLTVTEDNNIFVCDRNSKKVTQFNPDGKLMCRCDVSGIPWDICAFSNSILFVTLPQISKVLLLQRCTGKCLLAVGQAVSTGSKKYVSLTKVNTGVLACDNDTNIDLLDSNGNFIGSIISNRDKIGSSVSHRICAGHYEDSFWKLNVASKTISCYRLDGELLIYHRIPFEENTSDICSDCYHCVYGCDKKRIYSLTSDGGENILWTFQQELKTQPRMCVNSTRDKLFVSYQSGNRNILQTFTVSPKFLFLKNN